MTKLEELKAAYVGGDYAMETLAEEVTHAVKRWDDRAPPKNPNQMEISL